MSFGTKSHLHRRVEEDIAAPMCVHFRRVCPGAALRRLDGPLEGGDAHSADDLQGAL